MVVVPRNSVESQDVLEMRAISGAKKKAGQLRVVLL
jgi:hypothetical protein